MINQVFNRSYSVFQCLFFLQHLQWRQMKGGTEASQPPPLSLHLFSLLPFASFFPALIYYSVPVIYGFYDDTKLFKWNLPSRFYRIAFQKHFVKFIGKHLHRSSILSKGAGPGRSWRSIIEQVWKTVYDFLGACKQLLPKI